MPYSIDPDDIPNIAWVTKEQAVRELKQKMEENSRRDSVDGTDLDRDGETSAEPPKTTNSAYGALFSKQCALGKDICSSSGDPDLFSVKDWLALHKDCMTSESRFTRRRSSQMIPRTSRSPTQASAKPDDTATTNNKYCDEEVAEVETIQ
jgi:hypothetical protein